MGILINFIPRSTKGRGGYPVGSIIAWPLASAPLGVDADNWLECNGQAVNPVKYPKLAKLMSAVPDYRGIFLRGLGNVNTTDDFDGAISHVSSSLGDIQGDTSRSINGFLGMLQTSIWNGSAPIHNYAETYSSNKNYNKGLYGDKSLIYYDYAYSYRSAGMASYPQIDNGWSEQPYSSTSAGLSNGWDQALTKYKYQLVGDKDSGYSLIQTEDHPNLNFSNEYQFMRFSSSLVTPTSNENRPVNKAVRYMIKAR